MVPNIVNLFVEYIKLMLVLCGVLNCKFKKSWGVVIGFITSIALFIALGMIDNEYQVSIFFIVVVFFAANSIEGSKRFLFSMVSYVSICCVDELIAVIFRIVFSLSSKEIAEDIMTYCLMNSSSIILWIVISVILHKLVYTRKNTQNIQSLSYLYMFLFVAGPFATLIYIAPFNLLEFGKYEKLRDIMVLGVCVLGFLFLIIGIFLIYNQNSKRYYKEEAEINKKLLEAQEQYYQMLLKKEEETRRFRHDIKNHILCVDALLKEKKCEEAEAYLSQMNDVLDELKPKYQTGNMLVNAIVNDITHRYENVNLEWQGMLPEKVRLSNMDVCTIFSNILENAFHAASSCVDVGKVTVLIKHITNSLMITVENNMAGQIKEEKGRLFTTKSDRKNHGFGTINVASCIDVNGGSVDFNYTDSMFTTEIILPNVI